MYSVPPTNPCRCCPDAAAGMGLASGPPAHWNPCPSLESLRVLFHSLEQPSSSAFRKDSIRSKPCSNI